MTLFVASLLSQYGHHTCQQDIPGGEFGKPQQPGHILLEHRPREILGSAGTTYYEPAFSIPWKTLRRQRRDQVSKVLKAKGKQGAEPEYCCHADNGQPRF
jgi:hypothetical protein